MRRRKELIERRRYIRLAYPLKIAYTTPKNDRIRSVAIKNISADGLGFEVRDEGIAENSIVELKLDITDAINPVHAKARVVWKKRTSLEDGSPSNVGLEFTEIEEDNKNTFLKFLCDLIYELPKEMKHAHKKK